MLGIAQQVKGEQPHNDCEIPDGPVPGVFLKLVAPVAHHPGENRGQQNGNTQEELAAADPVFGIVGPQVGIDYRSGHQHHEHQDAVDHPPLHLPGKGALVAQVAERVSGSFSQPAAPANPGTVPPLPVKIRQYRGDHQDGQYAEDKHGKPDVAGIDKGIHPVTLEIVIVQRPDILEVVIRQVPVEPGHDLGDQKGEAQLEEHHADRPQNLIAVVPVFPDKLDAESQDSQGVECSVHKPLARGVPAQGLAHRVEEGNQAAVGTVRDQPEVFRVKIKDDIKPRQENSQAPGPDTPGRYRFKPDAVVFYALRLFAVFGLAEPDDPNGYSGQGGGEPGRGIRERDSEGGQQEDKESGEPQQHGQSLGRVQCFRGASGQGHGFHSDQDFTVCSC